MGDCAPAHTTLAPAKVLRPVKQATSFSAALHSGAVWLWPAVALTLLPRRSGLSQAAKPSNCHGPWPQPR